jgi:tetratricopeptide (TPR) repeat protein
MNSTNLPGQYADPLAGCELRVSVAGFRPMNLPMTHNSDLGRVDVGNINMERIGTSSGGGVSVTSLLIPKEAAKEYEKAVKELQNNKPESALPHLEKAVSLYDKYAAAWNALGRLYLSRNLFEKAGTAFEKSIAADPEYIPPLISLASIQIQNREWEQGIDTAGKALALESDIGFASFLQAVGNFNLNKLDEAERNARQAADAPNADDNPQIHALLAQIYLQRQDYSQAATQIRAYLKESPNGQFAEQMKKDLTDIENWVGEAGAGSSNTSAEPGS